MNYASYQNTQMNEPTQTIEQAVEEAIAEESKISEAEESGKPYISGLKLNSDVQVISKKTGEPLTIKYTRNSKGNLFKHVTNEDGETSIFTHVGNKWINKNNKPVGEIYESSELRNKMHSDFDEYHLGFSEFGSSAGGFGRFTAYRTETIDTVAAAEATIDARTGELRTVYYDNAAQRQIVDETAGTIEYDTGIIKIDNIYIKSVASTDGYIRLSVESEKGIISTNKNTIVTLDIDDPTAISTTLEIA
jgi:hypothetical protein